MRLDRQLMYCGVCCMFLTAQYGVFLWRFAGKPWNWDQWTSCSCCWSWGKGHTLL